MKTIFSLTLVLSAILGFGSVASATEPTKEETAYLAICAKHAQTTPEQYLLCYSRGDWVVDYSIFPADKKAEEVEKIAYLAEALGWQKKDSAK